MFEKHPRDPGREDVLRALSFPSSLSFETHLRAAVKIRAVMRDGHLSGLCDF